MAILSYQERILKDVVLKGIIQTELENSVLQARLKRTSRDIKGNYVESITQIQREQGIETGARAGTWPTASGGEFLTAKMLLRYMRGKITIDGPDRVCSEGSSDEAVASIAVLKGNSLMSSWAEDASRQMWGDGSGTLCAVSGGQVGVTTIVVDSVKYVRLGMIIDIHESTPITDRKITAIDNGETGNPLSITISGEVVTVTDTTVITRANSKDTEIRGFGAMLGTTAYTDTYANIPRADYPDWRAFLMDCEGAAITFQMLNEFFIKLCTERGSTPSICYCDVNTMLYIQYLWDKFGIKTATRKIELGHEVPTFQTPKGQVPIETELFCPDKTLVAVDERFLTLREASKPFWVPGTHGSWITDATNDFDIARLKWYVELLNTNPKTCGKIFNFVAPY